MLGVVGIIFIVTGIIFKALKPRKINNIYGYRTQLSMKNQDTWNESQRYSSNTFVILGFIYLALAFSLNYFIESFPVIYENTIILIGIVSTITLNEVHLRTTFNKDGSKKTAI